METGTIVRHNGKDGWGPGKIIKSSGDKVYIYFRDADLNHTRIFKEDSDFIVKAEVQSDPFLDHLPPFIERDGNCYLPKGVISWEKALQRFQDIFPTYFGTANYLTDEAGYKRSATSELRSLLLGGEAAQLLARRQIGTLVKQTFSIIGRSKVGNLLARFEIAALHDALKDEGAAEQLFTCLLRILDEPPALEPGVSAYFDAVLTLPAERARASTWPIATFLPFLACPDRFMFLKPEITKKAAERLKFDMRYDPLPNWKTYSALLQMSTAYLQKLAPYGATDFIDVQSFFFVTGGGYSES